MRRPTQGKGYVYAGPQDEADLVGCGHCQRQIETTPGLSVAVDMCRCCFRFICPPCHKALQTGSCVTWETMIDRMERDGNERARLRREMGLE